VWWELRLCVKSEDRNAQTYDQAHVGPQDGVSVVVVRPQRSNLSLCWRWRWSVPARGWSSRCTLRSAFPRSSCSQDSDTTRDHRILVLGVMMLGRPGQGSRRPVDVVMVSSVHLFGDSRVTIKEASALAREYTVALVQPATDPDNIGFEVESPTSIVDLFEQVPETEWAFRIRRMARAFRTTLRFRPRVVHLHDPELLALVSLWRLLGIRQFVFDAHENPAALLRESSRGRVRYLRALLRLIIRLHTRWTHVVIAEMSYRPQFSHAQSVTLVLNYPRSELISPPRIDAANSGRLRLVYLGLLAPERGLWDMIDACAELRRRGVMAELDLIGPAGPGLADELRSATGAAEGVRWCGPKPPPEAWRLLADYDIGLSVLHATENYRESFPTKIPEYLLAGLPVVATDVPLYRRSVHADDGRFVAPRSPKAVADAVEALMSCGLSAQGRFDRRRRAEERYTWESQAIHLVGLYRQLLSNGPPAE
jgi:glycosyltransferase involved in cell wall biosynthesis